MNPRDWIDLLTSLFRWFSRQRNPARQMASRVIEVFETHGIGRTSINKLLPENLRLPIHQWTSPDALAEALHQNHIDWICQRFALTHGWLTGESEAAHEEVFSYKAPGFLHPWFLQHRTGDSLEFKLHVLTPDMSEIGPRSRGNFALVLEHMSADDGEPSRFYHLTNGAHFEHYPCLVHLVQVMAIAHHHHAIPRRWRLNPEDLHRLAHQQGLIPCYLAKARSNLQIQGDHELWPHFSGESRWLSALRSEAEKGLLAAQLTDIIDTLHRNTRRFARH